ncbi:putative NADH-ubiquinone oxidoreductase 178 kDa subunit [Aspergillus clavatus NRRL 1]|uniref:NADH-ubiquinone oxidoreductase 178 kDa subunit, putative n=1 Tax=Aspergillus clavatus (strain ATCC 1007 / CBS 513.65 / DSM 816 / NCTC 3887 / NRRL 1 / QM 1276 / 107) TaxID=344612 RepID=A1C3X1_ASPCL|nr:NADH-ubiquinone oxidoreductase 178 kDa subunit, putative [Aspergillus clavatus NRRL 1]EAW15111.1 NADH-ubiquinone oxidoreductase 178 kDa subunit, putative [Aspergillus clavatus NRRL 1]
MSFARQSFASARQALRYQQPRRFASHAAHAEPVNESFGRSFYVTFGTFAAAYALYRVSQSTEQSGSQSWISSLIEKWTPSERVFEERNAVHTVLMEKAAHDRHLFLSQGPRATFELKQPEVSFNTSPPYNVPAGSSVDMSAVVAHYEREHQQMEEARVARMKDGKVVSLYD